MGSIVKGIGNAISGVAKGIIGVVKKIWKPLLIGALVYFGGAALIAGLSTAAAGTGGALSAAMTAGTSFTGANAAWSALGQAITGGGTAALKAYAAGGVSAAAQAGGATAAVNGAQVVTTAVESVTTGLEGSAIGSQAATVASTGANAPGGFIGSMGGGATGPAVASVPPKVGFLDKLEGALTKRPAVTKLAGGLMIAGANAYEQQKAEDERRKQTIWGVDYYGNRVAPQVPSAPAADMNETPRQQALAYAPAQAGSSNYDDLKMSLIERLRTNQKTRGAT